MWIRILCDDEKGKERKDTMPGSAATVEIWDYRTGGCDGDGKCQDEQDPDDLAGRGLRWHFSFRIGALPHRATICHLIFI